MKTKLLSVITGLGMACAALTSGMLCVASAEASVPMASAIEGILLASGGAVAADGTYSVAFALYKDELGGNALWAEGPVNITVKSGQWQYVLGGKTPLSASLLSGNLYLGLQVASDPELPRKQLNSVVFAVRAAVAESVECSGCIGSAQLDPKVLADISKTIDLSAYAKTSSLAKVATSGAFADLTGGPDLSSYAKTSDLAAYAKGTDLAANAKATSLAKVAGTGAYADLTGAPDLNAYVKAASLAKVAGTGSYTDLTDLPVLAQVGKSCGTGLVLSGIKADGSYECSASAIAADLIDEISNGLIWNQFTDSASGPAKLAIQDGFPAGSNSTLTFLDIGTAQKVWIDVDIANNDVSKLQILLYSPGKSNPYTLYDGTATGKTLKTTYNTTAPIAAGQFDKDWVGQNLKGTWTLVVKDLADDVPATTDGTVDWTLSIETLSNKKIQIKGDLIVDGAVTISGGGAGLTTGTIYRRVCSWSWQSNSTWQNSQATCAPPACSAGDTDLGVQQLTRSATNDNDPWCCWHSTTVGTSERLCLIPPTKPATVYNTQCQWVNSCYNCDNASSLVTSCTPPACASGHTDYGTQNVWNSVQTHTEYNQAHDVNAVAGWTERVCVIF